MILYIQTTLDSLLCRGKRLCNPKNSADQYRLIRSGDAIPFTGHAKSPTITMPRIKALTTGSIPSFLDVILNFAESDTTSTLANQDTWPLQLSLTKGGKINMFGDDTWIKLFPKLFSRMDGTTSFFVSVSLSALHIRQTGFCYVYNPKLLNDMNRTSLKSITMLHETSLVNLNALIGMA